VVERLERGVAGWEDVVVGVMERSRDFHRKFGSDYGEFQRLGRRTKDEGVDL
jgi:hypothetical protein